MTGTTCHMTGVFAGGYCLPGKGTLEFFFLPPFRANFDDLRPLKAKFDTFEHLWGSITRFCAPDFSWDLRKTSQFLTPKKFTKLPSVVLTPTRPQYWAKKCKKMQKKNAKIGCLTIWVHQIHGSAVLSHNQSFRAEESDEEFFIGKK